MKVSLIVDLAGNLQSRARQYAQALTGLSNSGSRAFSGLRNAAASVGRGLDGMGNRYTAMIAGAGITYKATKAVMDSAQLDKMLIRVAQTAGKTRGETESLRKELHGMANETGQSYDSLLQGFYGLIQSGQSFDEALATIKAINPAMAVTGAQGEVLGSAMSVAAQSFKFDLSNLETGKRILDQMTVAGRLGNAELEDLSSIFARIGQNAAQAGLSFEDTLAFIERLSLVERNPERLATLADSTLRLFNNQNYSKEAEKITGVKFFDKTGNRRNPFDVLADMSARYGKFSTDQMRAKGMFAAFGKTDLDTQRGLAMLLQQGVVNEARDMATEIKNAEGTIAKDLPAAIDNAVDQTARLKAALWDAADNFARPINDAINDGIKYILDTQQIGGKELLVGGSLAALGGFGALKLGGKTLGKLGGGVLGNAVKGMGLGRLPLPLPVYIVNDRISLTDGALSDLVNGGSGQAGGKGGAASGKPGAPVRTPRLPGKGGRMARIADFGKQAARNGASAGKFAAKAGAPVAVIGGVIEAGSVIMDPNATTDDKVRGVSEAAGAAVGGWGGAAGGAAIGAAIGSIIPGLGTAIGGALGGLIGGWLGTEAGEGLGKMIGDKLTDRDQAKAIGAEISAKSAELAENLAAESTIKIKVEGGQASIESTSGPGDIDVYYEALNMQGTMTMD